jgi:hypothetical protein
LELIKDYNLKINYHPGQANVIADALSWKKYCNATFARRMGPKLDREIDYLNLAVVNAIADAMEVKASLEVEIREGQMEDPKFTKIW